MRGVDLVPECGRRGHAGSLVQIVAGMGKHHETFTFGIGSIQQQAVLRGGRVSDGSTRGAEGRRGEPHSVLFHDARQLFNPACPHPEHDQHVPEPIRGTLANGAGVAGSAGGGVGRRGVPRGQRGGGGRRGDGGGFGDGVRDIGAVAGDGYGRTAGRGGAGIADGGRGRGGELHDGGGRSVCIRRLAGAGRILCGGDVRRGG